MPAKVQIKIGHIVRNERLRRWGQVTWDERRIRWETGQLGRIIVFCFAGDRSVVMGQADWDIADISVIVHKGKVIWEDKTIAERFDAMMRSDKIGPPECNVGGSVQRAKPL